MALDFSNSTELLQYIEKSPLFPKLIRQLKKDFVLANIDIVIKNETTGDKLKQLLQEKVYFLIMEEFNSYLNLLYVVDVPEKLFKEITVTDVVEVADQVSLLILKRELQKVRLREKYNT